LPSLLQITIRGGVEKIARYVNEHPLVVMKSSLSEEEKLNVYMRQAEVSTSTYKDYSIWRHLKDLKLSYIKRREVFLKSLKSESNTLLEVINIFSKEELNNDLVQELFRVLNDGRFETDFYLSIQESQEHEAKTIINLIKDLNSMGIPHQLVWRETGDIFIHSSGQLGKYGDDRKEFGLAQISALIARGDSRIVRLN